MAHSHSHSHGGGGCDDHDHQVEDFSTEFNLHTRIDDTGFQCLGEEETGSGRKIFKNYTDRQDKETFVDSDCDPELLFNVPFTGSVKLKNIIVIPGEDDLKPLKLRLFKNQPGLNFDDAKSKKPDQEIDIVPDPFGDAQYNIKIMKFNNVSHLSFYFPDSEGEENTRIYYIGMRGTFEKGMGKQPIVITNYELAANPADHKSKLYQANSSQMGH